MASPYFSDEELRCKHCKQQKMDPAFMDRLDSLRRKWDKPMVLTSAYRCPVYNTKVSSTGPKGPHTTGRAIDVVVRGADALWLLVLALECGFTGFGVQQKGDVRFLHLDDLPPGPSRPRPFLWSY
jgi:zinc D-Ala-D-Ala carboxypeptidase